VIFPEQSIKYLDIRFTSETGKVHRALRYLYLYIQLYARIISASTSTNFHCPRCSDIW